MNVFDYGEVFRVNLIDPVTIEVLLESPCDFEARTTHYFGISDREPIRAAGTVKISYGFDPKASSVRVAIESTQNTQYIDFRTLSGDWFVATLTPCGEFLVMAEPYLIEAYAL